MLILELYETSTLSTNTNQGKVVNAHDEPRGLYLFDWLGSRRPRTTDKKKVPRFFMPASQRKRKSEKRIAFGTWAKEKTNSKK